MWTVWGLLKTGLRSTGPEEGEVHALGVDTYLSVVSTPQSHHSFFGRNKLLFMDTSFFGRVGNHQSASGNLVSPCDIKAPPGAAK